MRPEPAQESSPDKRVGDCSRAEIAAVTGQAMKSRKAGQVRPHQAEPNQAWESMSEQWWAGQTGKWRPHHWWREQEHPNLQHQKLEDGNMCSSQEWLLVK